MADGTICRAHQKAAGARKDLGPQAIGRSRGGLTTKTVVLTDALSKMFDFVSLPGQAHELKAVEALIEGVSFEAFIAVKAYDADWLVDKLLVLNPEMKVVIPSRPSRKTRRDYDVEMNKTRRLVANFIAKAKEKRGTATRFGKTDSSYASRWYFVGMLEA